MQMYHHMGRQVRSDMFLHRRTLLNLILHRSQIGLTPMILDQVALKRRWLRYFGKLLVWNLKSNAEFIKDHTLRITIMLYILKGLKFLN